LRTLGIEIIRVKGTHPSKHILFFFIIETKKKEIKITANNLKRVKKNLKIGPRPDPTPKAMPGFST